MKQIFPLTILALLLSAPLFAQEDPALTQAKANEQRLRDNLRSVTQQLRSIEAENATLQSAQTEREQKIADLESRITQLVNRANEDKEVTDRRIADLSAGVLRGEQESARLSTSLDKWKKAHQDVTATAKATEAARAKLNSANIALERKVAARERQNLELYKTGKEILQRYTGFSLGRAIAAREPFTGIARARLEEQIQDYADQLEDAKLKPEPGDGKPSTHPAAAGDTTSSASAEQPTATSSNKNTNN